MDCGFSLENKISVVTGAEGGLGSAASMCYAMNGAHVAMLARNEEKLDKAAELVAKESSKKTLPIKCDVSDEENVKQAVDKIMDEFGQIDILLNCAGVAVPGGVEDLSWDKWDLSMRVNVGGIFLMCKYVIPHMRKRKYGKIVNVASINAAFADKVPELYRHSYNASKAAVLGLTKGLAASYAKDNITANSVGPGLFKTNMTENTLFADKNFMQMYDSLNPAGRPGEEGELNGTLVYLSSDASSYVTGQNIFVDGGFSIV